MLDELIQKCSSQVEITGLITDFENSPNVDDGNLNLDGPWEYKDSSRGQ